MKVHKSKVVRVSNIGELRGITSFSIIALSGQDYMLNGVRIPNGLSISQSVGDHSEIERIYFSPGEGDLLIAYTHCSAKDINVIYLY